MIRVGLFAVLTASVALAQNQPSPEQLQKAYDDALVQLKAAQDRKNELALENEKLQKRVGELEAQNQIFQERVETLENRTYFLREHYAAWHEFITLNPAVGMMWSQFFMSPVIPQTVTDILGDGRWPFSVEG